MATASSLFAAAIERFDASNAQDPRGEELVYAQRMTEWLQRLYPDASEPLRLAARAQHIRRWEIPRNQFPLDRIGYLRWRTSLYTFHADTAEAILRSVGYDEPTIGRVRSLLRKQGIKSDPETQALEDVACLVFLENYFGEFAHKHDEGKVIEILRKTWGKMSERGHGAAMKLAKRPEVARLMDRALREDGGGR